MKAVLIPGDGIGPEIAESIKAITKAMNLDIEWLEYRAGAEYAKEEMIAPKRTISSSVRLVDGEMEIVSVRLDKPVPKSMIFPIMEEIKAASAVAPVHIGDVLIHDVLSTGADVIVTRNVDKRKE